MSSTVNQPAFAPDVGNTAGTGATVNHSVTGSSTTALQIRTNASAHAPHVQIYNSGATIVFVRFGPSGVSAATTADTPIAPGRTALLALSGDYVRAIGSGAGPAVVYYTPGFGVGY